MFTVVTGHPCTDNDDLPWPELAQLGGPLVVLMGVRRRREIASGLADTPLENPTTLIVQLARRA